MEFDKCELTCQQRGSTGQINGKSMGYIGDLFGYLKKGFTLLVWIVKISIKYLYLSFDNKILNDIQIILNFFFFLRI